MTESQKLVRDLWNYAAKQRRLVTEATHAIVGLTRSLGDGEELADHTAVLDEAEAVDLQIADTVSEHAILDARVRCFCSTLTSTLTRRPEHGNETRWADGHQSRHRAQGDAWHLRQRQHDSAPAGSTA